MCYKPDMRKWMRDKLKRRKKSQEETSGGPAPLQPAYFATEAETPQPGEEEPEPIPEATGPAEGAVQPESVAQPGGPSPRRRSRRRRGRGRRGQHAPEPGLEASGAAISVSAPASADAVDAAAAVTTPPASAPRPPKGVVVLAVGLPGSGKSSWFKRHQIAPLSSDWLRSVLFDDPAEQRFQDLVFSNLRSMLKARLIARRPMNYVDATNLTPHERQHWVKLAKDFGYEVHAVFFDVPLEVCIERHHRRDRLVPEDVMRKMAAKLKPPTFEEGFSKITVVRVKQKPE